MCLYVYLLHVHVYVVADCVTSRAQMGGCMCLYVDLCIFTLVDCVMGCMCLYVDLCIFTLVDCVTPPPQIFSFLYLLNI